MDIRYTELSNDTLRGVIESFVNRSGTDYGAVEISLDAKVRDVLRQLEAGEAKIVFDTATQSIDIVLADDALSPSEDEALDEVFDFEPEEPGA
jgi:hypothetical protein